MNIPVYYPTTITPQQELGLDYHTTHEQRFCPGLKEAKDVPIRMHVAIPLTSQNVNWNIIHLTCYPFRKNVRS